MKRYAFALNVCLPILIFALAGCQRDAARKAGDYPIEGKVLSRNPKGPTIQLDHKDIPGLMQGMKMEFDLADDKLLSGISDGDQVRGKLKVTEGRYLITQLEKIGGEPDEEAGIKESLAKLSPQDRKLAEAQKFCAVQGKESRLGSMGPPVKIMLKDEPVFLCCKGCTKEAQAHPEKTLARVKELKK
jgi:Cu/Ag efflux protein CusF